MMNLQPTLQNELVAIRPLKEDDYEQLYQVAKDTLIWEQHPSFDRYKREVFSKFFDDSIASKGALVIIDKSNDKIIGSSRYKPVNKIENAMEIGWSFLSRGYWGGKYNGAMKRLMINHAFQTIEYIVFYIGKENIRSQKAVEKIGGVRITDSMYKPIIKDSQDDWTYLIDKSIWKNKTL